MRWGTPSLGTTLLLRGTFSGHRLRCVCRMLTPYRGVFPSRRWSSVSGWLLRFRCPVYAILQLGPRCWVGQWTGNCRQCRCCGSSRHQPSRCPGHRSTYAALYFPPAHDVYQFALVCAVAVAMDLSILQEHVLIDLLYMAWVTFLNSSLLTK